MAQYCHASHEVYHDGVAQRAHNLSPVPFGAAKRAKESSYHCSDTASQTKRFQQMECLCGDCYTAQYVATEVEFE